MVCEKAPDCDKDMDEEGLDLLIDGDFISAKGTSPVSYTHLTGIRYCMYRIGGRRRRMDASLSGVAVGIPPL